MLNTLLILTFLAMAYAIYRWRRTVSQRQDRLERRERRREQEAAWERSRDDAGRNNPPTDPV